MTELSSGTATATDLIAVSSGLRRALKRRIGRAGGVAELSEAQRELVRAVRRQPGMRVGEAADQLHLAANTVSTLVTGLCAAGWLCREVDPADRRSALLFLTRSAEERVAEWRDRRFVVLTEAMGLLDPADQERIAQALPGLYRLVELLEAPS